MTTSDTQSDPRRPNKAEVFRQREQKILEAHPEIIDALIEQAKKGSYQHAKFLFDLVDTTPAKQAEEESLPGPSLAEILLERLQIIEAENAAEAGSESGVMG
jgi:hypothetical protein